MHNTAMRAVHMNAASCIPTPEIQGIIGPNCAAMRSPGWGG
jgi:hypothetical protein